MAIAKYSGSLTYNVSLDASEQSTVTRHASREALTHDEGMSDIVEQAIASLAYEFCQEENESRLTVGTDHAQTRIVTAWPKVGPLSLLSKAEQEFVHSILDLAMDMALHTIVATKVSKEKLHELEG
jgi:hypothetical protein